MRAHLRYLSYVLRHKWFVLVAGLKVGAPLWRLLIHDWSKFLPSEWFGYVEWFYGGPWGQSWGQYEHLGGEIRQSRAAFDRAWLRHQHRNPHHWQHWVLREDNPSGEFRADQTSEDAWRLTLYGLHLATFHNVNNLASHYSRRVRDALNTKVLPMPEHFVREMVADWMGAGRAITGRWEVKEWYEKNRERILLHSDTEDIVLRILAELA